MVQDDDEVSLATQLAPERGRPRERSKLARVVERDSEEEEEEEEDGEE